MERDWEIVDDGDAQEEPVAPDDLRLDHARVRTIARERRARDRIRQWRVGARCFATIMGVILIVRAGRWMIVGERQIVGLSLVGAGVVLIGWTGLNVRKRR